MRHAGHISHLLDKRMEARVKIADLTGGRDVCPDPRHTAVGKVHMTLCDVGVALSVRPLTEGQSATENYQAQGTDASR